MSVRKKIAKSLRSGFGSVALCGTIISAPIAGGLAVYDHVVPDFENTTTAQSQQHFADYKVRSNALGSLFEEWDVMREGAKEQDSPEKARAFLAEKAKVETQILASAKKLSAEILTDPILSEVDYKNIEQNYWNFERRGIESDDFYLPNEAHALKESQASLKNDKGLTDQFSKAQKVRTTMESSCDGLVALPIGILSFLAFMAVLSFSASFKPQRKLADAIEKGTKKPALKKIGT